MDINKDVLIETFAHHFLLKERRERCLLELKNINKRDLFIDKLNHSWETRFDMNKLTKLQNNIDDFAFVKSYLNIKGEELVYLISNYNDLDDKILGFHHTFKHCYGRGFATLIISLSADKIYLETEVDYGQQNRFVGKIS